MIETCLLLCLALQAGSPAALQHLQAGVEADKQGRLDAAITEFHQATELDPNMAEGFADLGEVYMEKHDYGAAIPPLKRAVELSPELLPAHRLLGYALLSQGYAEESIPHLQQAHEQAALGIAQIEAGKLQEAVANLQSALDKRPNDPDLLYYLGRASGLLSKQAIDTLLDAYPNSARAHQALAENYFVLRQMPQAEREYRAALRLQPDLPGVHLELGEVYAGASQWDKAEAEFRVESKLQPGNAEAAYRLGNALLQEGKAVEARIELERADRLQPQMPETLYSLGKAAALAGDAASAEKSWTKLLSIENDSALAAQAHFGLAGLYRKQGKTAQAAHELEEFQKLQGAASPGNSAP
jgi:tetratricopeptide (TPR) repeat protein